MSYFARVTTLLVLLIGLADMAASQTRIGDQWTLKRGDLSPGLNYAAITRTPSGRIIAIRNSQLMVSDNNGTTWRYSLIFVDGRLTSRSPLDIAAITLPGGGTRVVATAAFMREKPETENQFTGSTVLLYSDDEGESWRETDFPYSEVERGEATFEGVYLTGLHAAPNGKLLAYGTTAISNDPILTWFVGGLIYTSDNGLDWEETNFSLGKIEDVTDANGRITAVGSNTYLDSAEGIGWTGYLLSEVNLELPNGDPLERDIARRLRLSQIVVQDGVYIADAATYVPWRGNVGIDSSEVDQLYTLSSGNPLDGARLWQVVEQEQWHGVYVPGSSVLLGFSGLLYGSADNGSTWDVVDQDVRARTGTVVRAGTSTVIALESSNEAWRSSDGGNAWTRVWDQDVGPDLRLQTRVGDTLIALANGEDIWASTDNGDTWQQRADNIRVGTQECPNCRAGIFKIIESQGRLFASRNRPDLVQISDDGGFTWETRDVDTDGDYEGAGRIVQGADGRLVIPSEGRSNGSDFYYSDDNGETWNTIEVSLPFNYLVRESAHVGGGRLIGLYNEFASFGPKLVRSDDNGLTWYVDDQLGFLEGLDTPINDPTQTLIEMLRIEVSPTGRVLILGEDEIISSDDRGDSWTVSTNLDRDQPASFRDLRDLVYSGGRWMALGVRRDPNTSENIVFSMVSDDDGDTWREQIYATQQSNTSLSNTVVGLRGRVIAGGNNSAIYTTEGPLNPADLNPQPQNALSVREGDILDIPIQRPPVPGAISLRYSAVQDTAMAGEDYEPQGGRLTWGQDDQMTQTISLVTVDDQTREDPELLRFQLVIEDDLIEADSEIAVTILDNDGTGTKGVTIVGGQDLYTSESGSQASFSLHLNELPNSNVEVRLTNQDAAEGSLSTDVLTFTPQDWNVPQTVVVTGVADGIVDGDAAYRLSMTIDSADPDYGDFVVDDVYVTNSDIDQFILDSSFEFQQPTRRSF